MRHWYLVSYKLRESVIIKPQMRYETLVTNKLKIILQITFVCLYKIKNEE